MEIFEKVKKSNEAFMHKMIESLKNGACVHEIYDVDDDLINVVYVLYPSGIDKCIAFSMLEDFVLDFGENEKNEC